jgi:hypothetical protein
MEGIYMKKLVATCILSLGVIGLVNVGGNSHTIADLPSRHVKTIQQDSINLADLPSRHNINSVSTFMDLPSRH